MLILNMAKVSHDQVSFCPVSQKHRIQTPLDADFLLFFQLLIYDISERKYP